MTGSTSTETSDDVLERIKMYVVAGGIAMVYLLNWLLP
jgi:hypothetical protein